MRKNVTVFVAALLVVSVLFPAAPKAATEQRDAPPVSRQTNAVLLSRQEAVTLLLSQDPWRGDIALEEAENKLPPAVSRDKYHVVLLTQKLENQLASLEVSGLYFLYASGSFHQFNQCIASWVSAASPWDYSWDLFHVTDASAPYPAQSLHLMARGSLSLQLDSQQVKKLGSALKESGFEEMPTAAGQKACYAAVFDLDTCFA